MGPRTRAGCPTIGAALLTLLIALTGCASEPAENDDPIAGQWTVTRLITDDTPVGLGTSSILIDISSAESSVTIEGPCQRLYGSFSFFDDGTASFTLPGSTTNECQPADEQLEDALRSALEGVTAWTRTGDRLVLRAPSARVEVALVG